MSGIVPFMPEIPTHIKETRRGRGATHNPANRFEEIAYVPDYEEGVHTGNLKTKFYKDTTKSIISTNDSPDIPFRTSINPYRGCEHGCVYCYARPTHEYFGLSSGLDFESVIFVKEDAPQLLRKELSHKKWDPQVVVLSGVTDCYQPIEKKLQITRGCLEVLLDYRNPCAIITKNHLVTKDIDVLSQMAQDDLCAVNVSITTLDRHLAKVMEPRASTPMDRLKTIEQLAKAGIPAGVMTAPIIPGLNDHEIPALLKAAREAGAQWAGYVVLRLPYALKELFESWLGEHFPDRKDKVLNRLKAMRGGKLYDAQWNKRMSGEGIFAQQIEQVFDLHYKRLGFGRDRSQLSIRHFRNPEKKQFEFLF